MDRKYRLLFFIAFAFIVSSVLAKSNTPTFIYLETAHQTPETWLQF